MRAVKFINGLLVGIFTILLMCLSITTIYFSIAKEITSKESISSYLNESKVLDCQISDCTIDLGSTGKIRYIDKDLLKYKIPKNVTQEVVTSKELNNILTNYIYSMSYKQLGNPREKSTLEIINLIDKKYYESTNKHISDENRENLSGYILDLKSDLDYSFEKFRFNENEIIFQNMYTVFTYKYILIPVLIIILLLMTMIFIYLRKITKTLNWYGILSVVIGSILLITGFMEVSILSSLIKSKGILDSLIISVSNKGFGQLLIYGIIFISVGIILLIISAILMKKESKEKSNELLEKSIEEEIKNQKFDEPLNEVQKDIVTNDIVVPYLDNYFYKEPISNIKLEKDGEIPKVIIKGNDFDRSDYNDIKPKALVSDNKFTEHFKQEMKIKEEQLEEKKPNILEEFKENKEAKEEVLELSSEKPEEIEKEETLQKEPIIEKNEEKTKEEVLMLEDKAKDQKVLLEGPVKEKSLIKAPQPKELLPLENKNIIEESKVDHLEKLKIEDKKDIKVFHMTEVKPQIVTPKKGKEIIPLLEEKDEEIELL